jgi:fluoride ion exporter CrcB/FEX
MIGLCGGYTTFSSFLQTQDLPQEGTLGRAAVNTTYEAQASCARVDRDRDVLVRR